MKTSSAHFLEAFTENILVENKDCLKRETRVSRRMLK